MQYQKSLSLRRSPHLAAPAVSNNRARGWGSIRFDVSNRLSVVSRYVKPRACVRASLDTLSRATSLIRYILNDVRWTSNESLSILYTLPAVVESDDVGLRPCCKWYILGVSIAGGAPRLPGATATLVMVISRDDRGPQCLRSTSSPRPSVSRATSHPQVVANL